MVEKHRKSGAEKRRTGVTRAVVVLAVLLVLCAAVYMIGTSSRDTLPDEVQVVGWPESGGIPAETVVSAADRPTLKEFSGTTRCGKPACGKRQNG